MDNQRTLYATYLRSYVIGILEVDVEAVTHLVAEMGVDEQLDIAIALGVSDSLAENTEPQSLKDFLKRIGQKLTPSPVRDDSAKANAVALAQPI